MSNKISILGCNSTGVQAAVYLLEQYYCEVLAFDDSNADYAKGMALDCMQASAIRDWAGTFTAVDNAQLLAQSDILIVSENLENELPADWIALAKSFKCVIFAAKDPNGIAQAIDAGIDEKSIIGVHGLVDSKVLSKVIADELHISISDVHALICCGVGAQLNSKPELVRVNGIPVNLIQDGLYDKVIEKARSLSAYDTPPWGLQYTLAAAAVEIALIMESGNSMIVPITGKNGTVPCKIGNYAIQQVFADL